MMMMMMMMVMVTREQQHHPAHNIVGLVLELVATHGAIVERDVPRRHAPVLAAAVRGTAAVLDHCRGRDQMSLAQSRMRTGLDDVKGGGGRGLLGDRDPVVAATNRQHPAGVRFIANP